MFSEFGRRVKKGNTVYIRYVVGRKYHADRKYNIPKHKIIEKAIADDPSQMTGYFRGRIINGTRINKGK